MWPPGEVGDMSHRETGGLPEYAASTFEDDGEKTAFVEVSPDPAVLPEGKSPGELSFGELQRRSDRVANTLLDLGYEKGDVLSVQLPNWLEFPILHLGALKAGLVTLPILAEHRTNEVGFMVDLCESDVVVIPAEFRGFDYVEMIEGLIDDGEIDPDHVAVVGEFEADDDRFHPYEWLESAADDPVESPFEADDLTQVLFTSGTTGEPKGVRQTRATGMSHVLPPNEEIYGIDDSDVIFAVSPIAHNAGFHYSVRLTVATGCRCVLYDNWVPEEALSTMAEHGCTFCLGATTFLSDLLHHPDVDAYDLPAFRMFVLSGSPIPRPVVEEAYDQFANITVVKGWGQTENGVVTATRPDDPIERIATTDGKAISHCEVTVRDEYGGEQVLEEPGKLLMRGDSLFDGYHRRPEKTAEALTEDGWLETGDIAVMDGDGYIRIEGREDDIIIRGGENISAAEVEEIIVDHPAVEIVAVVAMPDERLQERPCAYVKPVEGAQRLTVGDLHEYLTERGVQAHKHPERIEYVEAFPRTSTGKIRKFRLREDVADKLGMDPV